MSLHADDDFWVNRVISASPVAVEEALVDAAAAGLETRVVEKRCWVYRAQVSGNLSRNVGFLVWSHTSSSWRSVWRRDCRPAEIAGVIAEGLKVSGAIPSAALLVSDGAYHQTCSDGEKITYWRLAVRLDVDSEFAFLALALDLAIDDAVGGLTA